jgi:hypothetical protein
MVEDHTLDRGCPWVAGQASLSTLVEDVGDLAKDVELALIGGGIPDPNRP